jgi:hypothetical protein
MRPKNGPSSLDPGIRVEHDQLARLRIIHDRRHGLTYQGWPDIDVDKVGQAEIVRAGVDELNADLIRVTEPYGDRR